MMQAAHRRQHKPSAFAALQVSIVSFGTKAVAVFGPFGGFPGQSTYEDRASELKA
jgi:hypothetical protein